MPPATRTSHRFSRPIGGVGRPRGPAARSSRGLARIAIGKLPAVLAVLAILAIWLDAATIEAIHVHLTPALDGFFGGVSEIADARTYAIVALGVYGISLAAMSVPAAWRWRPRLERAVRGSLLMLLSLLTGGLLTLILKHLVARARPFMLLEHGSYGAATPFSGFPFNSFPSSHAFTAFAAACAMAQFMPAWRIPLLMLAAIVGICRVLTLEHFPSDVVASAFIAAWCVRFWAPRVRGSTFGRLAPRLRWRRRTQTRPELHANGAPTPNAVAAPAKTSD